MYNDGNFSFVEDFLIKNFIESHEKYFRLNNFSLDREENLSYNSGFRKDFKDPAVQLLWEEWQFCATINLTGFNLIVKDLDD